MRRGWQREKEKAAANARGNDAPGSPTRSPSKWKASSGTHKEQLAKMSSKFWELVDPAEARFVSPALCGPGGASLARRLMVHCSTSFFAECALTL